MVDLFRQSAQLQEAARCAAVNFLRTELRVANTFLDLARGARTAEVEARHCAEARAAYAQVATGLIEGSHPTLTNSEQGELATGLTALAKRFDDWHERDSPSGRRSVRYFAP